MLSFANIWFQMVEMKADFEFTDSIHQMYWDFFMFMNFSDIYDNER